jgi:hypothetical protein
MGGGDREGGRGNCSVVGRCSRNMVVRIVQDKQKSRCKTGQCQIS